MVFSNDINHGRTVEAGLFATIDRKTDRKLVSSYCIIMVVQPWEPKEVARIEMWYSGRCAHIQEIDTTAVRSVSECLTSRSEFVVGGSASVEQVAFLSEARFRNVRVGLTTDQHGQAAILPRRVFGTQYQRLRSR
jgi:hypothetical protein